MHEAVEEVIRKGVFPHNPLIVYDLTPAEMRAACDGHNERKSKMIELNNVYFGTICATIVNTTPRKKGSKAMEWHDFFGKKPEKTEQTPGTMKMIAEAITKAMGGRIRGSRR